MAFVENRGQVSRDVRFMAVAGGMRVSFRQRGVTIEGDRIATAIEFDTTNNDTAMEATSPLSAHANYLIGQDSRRWKTGLPMFSVLRYRNVWPGIDIEFESDGERLQQTFFLSEVAELSDIQLRIPGSALLPDGTIRVGTEQGVVLHAPTVYRRRNGHNDLVTAAYAAQAEGAVGLVAAAAVSAAESAKPPTFLFTGYFGGSAQTNITSTVVNSRYDTIVAGWTVSTNLPATGTARTANAGGVDAFVASFSPAGGTLNFCTYLGGNSDDRALAVAVDYQNDIYLTGQTSSANFPVAGGGGTKLKGARDAFLARLSSDGKLLLFSSLIGGSGVDYGTSITLDSLNRIVIAGDTTSSDLPVTPSAVQPRLSGPQNGFVAVFPTGSVTASSMTYFGGNSSDHVSSVRTDSSGAIFLGGSTYSTQFHAENAFQPRSRGGQDGFVAKLSSDCRQILFSTYLGGAGGSAGAAESVNAISIGPSGNLNVVGTTSSPDFPIVGAALQPVNGGGNTDGFIARIRGTTGALILSTYFGGASDDGINAIATGVAGEMFIGGYTSSTDFPTVNAASPTNAGGLDGFAAKLTFEQIMFSTFLGGRGNDTINAVAIDSLGSMVVAGSTGSSDFPLSGSMQGWPGVPLSSFVTRIAPRFTLAVAAGTGVWMDIWHNTGYNGTTQTLKYVSFGQTGDILVAGDWDGTGGKRIGLFRNGLWILDVNGNGSIDAGDKTVTFGLAGDVPIVGDWDGTGRLKLGLFRKGTFILDLSGRMSGVPTGVADAVFPFGNAADVPIAGDWNRSGTTKVGVFRDGAWLLDFNGDRAFSAMDKTYAFGKAGDVPVLGDWDGSGATKIGVYRQGVWILDYFGGTNINAPAWLKVIGFGSSGHTPLVL